jgi:hypothetical protein
MNHNDARWYVVRWVDERRQPRRPPFPAGWYVVRVCPCHFGHVVIEVPSADKEGAEHSREVILSVSPT